MDGIEAPAPVGDSGNTNGDGARPLSRSRSNSGVGGGGDHSPSRSRSAKRGYVRADAGTFLSLGFFLHRSAPSLGFVVCVT